MHVMHEAFTGEFACGKSEIAVNRAIWLKNSSPEQEVTLVDMDTVNPFYTLRPLQKKLTSDYQINVITWQTKDLTGIGETGGIIVPSARWALRRAGHVLFDVGYGVEGSRILNLVHGFEQDSSFKVYLLINLAKPLTSNKEDIIKYLQKQERIDGVINNSHLGNETDIDFIKSSMEIVADAVSTLHIPLTAHTVDKKFRRFFTRDEVEKKPVWFIERFMPEAFW